MFKFKTYFSYSLLLAISFTTNQSFAAADCNSLNQKAHLAYKSKNVATLENLLAKSDKVCFYNEEKLYILNLTARVLYDTTENKHLTDQQKTLENVITIAPEYTKTAWLAREKLGDVLHQQGFYESAFRAYESALNIIGYPSDTPENIKPKILAKQAPSATRIKKIHKKAQRDRLLTDTFIFSSKAGNGEIGGIQRLGTKGSCVNEVAIPIVFNTAKTSPNSKGLKYTTQLKSMLAHYNNPRITIIGHTDERNKTGKNQALSEGRANYVKRYLEKNGYTKNLITAIGVSSSQPYDDPEYDDYPKDKRYQIDRRVEVIFPENICSQ